MQRAGNGRVITERFEWGAKITNYSRLAFDMHKLDAFDFFWNYFVYK